MKKKLIKLLLFEALLFCVGWLALVSLRLSVPADAMIDAPEGRVSSAIAFETTPGFYEEDITVYISGSENCTIYYTLNGTEPETPAAKGGTKRYSPQSGIALRAPEDKIGYYSLTARAYYPDGTWGESIRSTYVVGEGANSRFTTMAIFITCDPDKLFGYEEGILVLGKTRADWLAANPDEKVIAISPAGYNLRGWASEREVNVEFFDTEGNQLINQSVGIRPSGAYSRAQRLKSLKLFARKDYEEVNFRFDYPLYGDLYTLDGTGRLRLDFKRVLLRSSGNDLGGAQFKDEVNQTAAAMAGFPMSQAVRPCSVYINGEYYGSMWMHDVVSDDFFVENYGEYAGTMGVVTGPEMSKPDERYEIDSIEEDQFMYDDWNNMYNTYKVADMTDDAVYAEFCKVFDVENYLFYYAINTYLNNNDWPSNNHKAYRYYAAEGEEYREGTVFDGRWRFIMHDVDNTRDPYGDLLNDGLLNPTASRRSELFGALMKREECRDIFIGYMFEVMNGAFSTENYISIIETMHQERLAEATMYTTTSRYAVNNIANIEASVEKLREFAKLRPKTMIDDLVQAFGISKKTYTIHIQSPENAYIMTGYWKIEENFHGKYSVDCGESFEIYPAVGYVFSHWVVNGEAVYDRVLTLDYNDSIGGTINVRAVIERQTEDLYLTIYEYSSAGSGDYMILYNPFDVAISTAGYQLSDSANKLGKYTLPAQIVEPGEYLTIYCDNYIGKEMLHQMCLPFSFKTGESIYLSYRYEILETVTFIDLHDGYVARRNLSDGKLYEVKAD
ncbi:MAG: CotH kinase family protein [Clostridia bacterium]|nr:CotH kinase family protein [Clostridia bacterium]